MHATTNNHIALYEAKGMTETLSKNPTIIHAAFLFSCRNGQSSIYLINFST